MRRMIMGFAGSILSFAVMQMIGAEGEIAANGQNLGNGQKKISSRYTPFQAKDYSALFGMPGFSRDALQLHFKLYQGYVTNTNLIFDLLTQYASEGRDRTPPFAELKRRLMWEYDGMRLHEDYFENLGGRGTSLDIHHPLAQQIDKDFGSYDQWKADFVATGAMRGIGWAVLVFDPLANRLVNTWINEHDRGHLRVVSPF